MLPLLADVLPVCVAGRNTEKLVEILPSLLTGGPMVATHNQPSSDMTKMAGLIFLSLNSSVGLENSELFHYWTVLKFIKRTANIKFYSCKKIRKTFKKKENSPICKTPHDSWLSRFSWGLWDIYLWHFYAIMQSIHLQRMNTIYVLCVGDCMFQIIIWLKYTIQ